MDGKNELPEAAPKKRGPRGPYKKREKAADAPQEEKKVPKLSKMEAGYQETTRIQMDQIRELIQKQADIECDIMRLKSERDELLQGLISLRTSIDKLHRILHDGEN